MSRLIKLLLITGLGVIFIYFASNIFHEKKIIRSIPIEPNVKNEINPTRLPVSDNLKKTIDNALLDTQGTYGIVVKNLKTGESYYFNEHKVFDPGSLYKIWVMATVFNEIQSGQLKDDEILSQDVKVLNNEFDIDPQSAELSEGTITLSVKDALEQMITISHNYAAYLLSEKVKLLSVSNFLSENHFDESALGEPPKTTAFDIALFFEKLYKGQLVDEENTKDMVDLLKKQTLNDKLPKYLPKNIVVAHKTGEINYLSHDAGIVFTDKGDYIIVILSQSDYPPGAEERIAQISQAVYQYFVKEK